MLMLSLKVGQKLYVNGKQIEIQLTEIDRGKVRIGITAPKDVPVMRSELLERMSAEAKLARWIKLDSKPATSKPLRCVPALANASASDVVNVSANERPDTW